MYGAVVYGNLTSATFNNCVFHDNSNDGIYGSDKATIHLHGETTAIHSNGDDGIYADSVKVLIHLPSHHNTLYNNKGEDRKTSRGGTITNVED